MDFAEMFECHRPWQDEWEMRHLVGFVAAETEVRTALEIGTHRGGSARMWRDCFGCRVVTVDVEPFDLGDDMEGITVVQGRSQSPETRRLVAEKLGGPADFLFVDGGHSYPEVWADYEIYGRFVRPGGVIVFHDVGAGNSPNPVGCHAGIVWGEISGKGGRSVTWKNGQGTGAIIKD